MFGKKYFFFTEHVSLYYIPFSRVCVKRNVCFYVFDLKGENIIKPTPNKKKRLAIESAVILPTETIKQRAGTFQLSPTLAQLIIIEHNINKHFTLNQAQTLHCYL